MFAFSPPDSPFSSLEASFLRVFSVAGGCPRGAVSLVPPPAPEERSGSTEWLLSLKLRPRSGGTERLGWFARVELGCTLRATSRPRGTHRSGAADYDRG